MPLTCPILLQNGVWGFYALNELDLQQFYGLPPSLSSLYHKAKVTWVGHIECAPLRTEDKATLLSQAGEVCRSDPGKLLIVLFQSASDLKHTHTAALQINAQAVQPKLSCCSK